jgi:prepilin-type N-terminal cleavage/methylation domain-containing protein
MLKRHKHKAFTLIELLVVIAIIAALVSILAVAQKKVKIVSKNLQQKAAFHAGEISLELFSGDFGGYPDSSQINDAGGTVTGAQRLAEALFGRDEQGFHPKSKWHPALDLAIQPDLYTNATLKDRKTPYFERKENRTGFYTINDLWSEAGIAPSSVYDSSTATNGTGMAPVFTDVFRQNKVTLPSGENIKVGMPILYYKADPTKEFRMDRDKNPVVATIANCDDWVYNFNDNLAILELPWLRDPQDTLKETGPIEPHFPDDDNDGVTDSQVQRFYKLLTHTERDNDGDGQSDFIKPYNKDSFIFISAGYDGIYGTKDDLTNFDY